MKLSDTPVERFIEGFKIVRHTEYATKEILPHQGPDWYWVPSTGFWWQRGQFWHEKDVGLETVGANTFVAKLDKLFDLIGEAWKRVRIAAPDAIWNPYSFKFVVVPEEIPESTGGPVSTNRTPPRQQPHQRMRRRLERDLRIADVNGLYARGQISADVRDSRIALILAEYPDLN